MSAGGEKSPNLGEKNLEAVTTEGKPATVALQRADVVRSVEDLWPRQPRDLRGRCWVDRESLRCVHAVHERQQRVHLGHVRAGTRGSGVTVGFCPAECVRANPKAKTGRQTEAVETSQVHQEQQETMAINEVEAQRRRPAKKPLEEEVRAHHGSHLPFRDCCLECVAGRFKDWLHRSKG